MASGGRNPHNSVTQKYHLCWMMWKDCTEISQGQPAVKQTCNLLFRCDQSESVRIDDVAEVGKSVALSGSGANKQASDF